MKNKWRNYALKDGKVKSSYIREYSNRKKVRKTRKASNCDSNEQSGKEHPKEEEVKLVQRGPEHYKVGTNPIILKDAWVINLKEGEDGEERSAAERSGGDGEGSGSIVAMPDIPRKQTRRRRKTANTENPNRGL